jgi:hypothetical protein
MTSDQPTMTLLRPRMRTSANFARVEAARFDSLENLARSITSPPQS